RTNCGTKSRRQMKPLRHALGLSLRPAVKMRTAPPSWDERTSAPDRRLGQSRRVFECFFERSVDAVWLFDPQAKVFVDCNPAAVELMRAGTKEKLLGARPEVL